MELRNSVVQPYLCDRRHGRHRLVGKIEASEIVRADKEVDLPDLVGLEVLSRQIEGRQVALVVRHIIKGIGHIRTIGGVQIVEILKLGQIPAVAEPARY